MPILRHLHLASLTSYAHASRLQEILVARLLRHKALLSSGGPFLPASPSASAAQPAAPPPPLPPPPPPPTILTFVPHPIYTTGRRAAAAPPSAAQLALLTQPLDAASAGPPLTAAFAPSRRGGQITFHGPGQLVVYPVLSLARPYSFAAAASPGNPDAAGGAERGLSPRCYVHLLEAVTIATLARYGIHGIRTDNPGVWVDPDTKIAALGVHLRRNVTSHGVGLNVNTDLRWFKRIVACGLEGKEVTNMWEKLGGEGPSVEEMADVWVSSFARKCSLTDADIVTITEEDILAEDYGQGV